MILRLATYLATLNFGSVTGEVGKRPIFAFQQVDFADDAILLTTGSLGEGMIDEELPSYYKAEVQVIVSARTILDARDTANQLVDALTLREVDLGEGVIIKRCFPRHRPYVYTKNEGQLVEASVNYDITYTQI